METLVPLDPSVSQLQSGLISRDLQMGIGPDTIQQGGKTSIEVVPKYVSQWSPVLSHCISL
jgi:hypothetical protein